MDCIIIRLETAFPKATQSNLTFRVLNMQVKDFIKTRKASMLFKNLYFFWSLLYTSAFPKNLWQVLQMLQIALSAQQHNKATN